MKTSIFLLVVSMAISINIACSGQTEKKDKAAQLEKSDKVEVYYFHFTRRCATCNAVESVTKNVINEFYKTKVSFAEYNLDQPEGQTKGKSLGVSGQMLLIVAGNQKIDLTNEAFLNARNNPEKLKSIIKENIDGVIK